MEKYVKLAALSQAALEALVAGAGIAIFFALGLRGLAMWTGDEVDGIGSGLRAGGPSGATAAVGTGRRNPAGLALAVLCFAVVGAIVVVGLSVMLTSK
jgi:hypothetical protein